MHDPECSCYQKIHDAHGEVVEWLHNVTTNLTMENEQVNLYLFNFFIFLNISCQFLNIFKRVPLFFLIIYVYLF